MKMTVIPSLWQKKVWRSNESRHLDKECLFLTKTVVLWSSVMIYATSNEQNRL